MERSANCNCPLCSRVGKIFLAGNFSSQQMSSLNFAARGKVSHLFADYYRCNDCSLLYQQSPLREEQLIDLYRRAEVNEEEGRWAAQSYLSIVQKLKVQGKILDVGANSLSFVQLLPVQLAIALDPINSEGISLADALERKGIFAVKDSLRPHLLPANYFDMITLFMTIEHLFDPLQKIKEIYRALKVGGYLVMTMHDFTFWLNRFKRSPVYDLQHLQLFNQRSIFNLLAPYPFAIIEISRYSNNYPLSYWARLLGWSCSCSWMLQLSVGNFYVIAQKIG